MRVALVVLVALASPGCGKKAKQGLPPAENWDQAGGQAGQLAALEQSQRPRAAAGGDPHAGIPGAPQLGGMAADDPHAGLDMSGGGGGEGGVDVTKMLPPPDPNRKIDPSRRVKGSIKVDPKLASRVPVNAAIFLAVRRVGPDGQPAGSPLAVEKLAWTAAGVSFELTEINAMSGGTELTGEVVVSARYDQDADALTKQPGDVAGQARAKVPAEGVVVMLDTVLP